MYIEGRNFPLYPPPLEQYWERTKYPRPNFKEISTANRRGYSGAWLLDSGKLFLIDLSHPFVETGQQDKRVGLIDIFKKEEYPVKAIWFYGNLVIGLGKIIRSHVACFRPEYEREFLLSVENGEVTKVILKDNIGSYRVTSENDKFLHGKPLWLMDGRVKKPELTELKIEDIEHYSNANYSIRK